MCSRNFRRAFSDFVRHFVAMENVKTFRDLFTETSQELGLFGNNIFACISINTQCNHGGMESIYLTHFNIFMPMPI